MTAMETYETLKMEVISFECEDVIITSDTERRDTSTPEIPG